MNEIAKHLKDTAHEDRLSDVLAFIQMFGLDKQRRGKRWPRTTAAVQNMSWTKSAMKRALLPATFLRRATLALSISLMMASGGS